MVVLGLGLSIAYQTYIIFAVIELLRVTYNIGPKVENFYLVLSNCQMVVLKQHSSKVDMIEDLPHIGWYLKVMIRNFSICGKGLTASLFI